MKKTTCMTIAILLVACSQTMANFSGGDDFNDNDMDNGKWSNWSDPFDASPVAVIETFGKLQFSGSEGEAGVDWLLNAGSYTQDWAVVIDAHNADDNRIAGMAVIFGPENSWVNIEHYRHADLEFLNEHAAISGFGTSDDDETGAYFGHFIPITNDTIQLGLAFDSTTKTLYGAFNTGSGFVVVTNHYIAGVGMGASDTFSLGLYAGTEGTISVAPGTLYFDNFEASPSSGFLDSDSDGDGHDLLEELVAGTDPNDMGSVFEFSGSGSSPAGFVLNWNAVANRSYTVEWTDHLTNTFQVLTNGVAYSQNSYTDTVHSAEGEGFYRVNVQLTTIEALSVGLVAYYPLDGNAQDSSGNGHHGSALGGLVYTPGKNGQAALFDGVGTLIEIADHSDLDIGSGAGIERTMSFWMNKNDSSWSSIMNKGTGGSSSVDYHIFLENGNLIWGTGPAADSGAWLLTPQPSIGLWHHVALTFSSTGLKKIYIDGSAVAMGSFAIKNNSGSDPLKIGTFFDGKLDEIRIYDRVLTSLEIQHLHQLDL